MYPVHLENQTAKIFKKIFSRKFKEINREILSGIKAELESRKSTGLVLDSENDVIRLDSDELDRLLSEVRPIAGLSDSERRQAVKSMASLDAWARSQVKSQIDNQMKRMNNPPPRPGIIQSNRSSFRVPAITLGETETAQVLDNLKSQVNQNFDTVSEIFKKHGDEVRNLVKENVAKGTSYSDLAKEIEKKTGVDEKRAELWARDQSQRFVSEQETIRAKSAGFPGFYWRTQRDSRVRDTHRHYNGKDLDGQYFTWDNLPVLNRQGTGMPGPLEPGQDYQCRCFKELDFPPDNEAQSKIDNPFQEPKFDRVRKFDSRHEPISGAFPKQRISVKADEKLLLSKYHSKLESMTRDERLRYIERARFATIDQGNIAVHGQDFVSRGIDLQSDYGVNLHDMIKYILLGKNYDLVTPYIDKQSETLGFLNLSLGIFVAVAPGRGRVKTIFPIKQDWLDYFYDRSRLLL